jgi:hypothetical protein
LPGIFAEHVKVDVPEPPPVDVEDRLQDILVEFVVAARVIVPVNPFIGDTVIVVTERLVGLAAIAKSWIWYVTVAE